MKSVARSLFVALAIGVAFLPLAGRAAQLAAEVKTAQLDALVSLTPDQKAQAVEIFRRENAVLNGLNPESTDPAMLQTWFTTRETSRNEIRALLTPAQTKIYEHSRQTVGGGMMYLAPSDEVARLDRLVHLAADQKSVAGQIFDDELESLLDLPAADRLSKGGEIRQRAKAEIRAILSPDQQKIYNRAPQSDGGALMANPEGLVARLNQVIPLTADQKAQATRILWNEVDAQLAAATPDHPPQGFRWTPEVRDQLRALLTPDQQAKFDVTPPYRSSGRPGAKG